MTICLINPPWVTKKGNVWREIRAIMPPLGLLYLAAVLEKENIPVDVLDFQAGSSNWEEIETTLREKEYDYYGITGTTSIISHAYRIAEIIKRYHPQAKIILGGVHATALPEEALQRPAVDYVIRGEGEQALVQLLRGEPREAIQGLSYRQDGAIRHIRPDGLMLDLDKIPFPAFHKVDMRLYRPAFGAYKSLPGISMLTTRGCPGTCTFCNSAGIPLRTRSAENIFAEIQMLHQTYGIREIQFYDDTFTVYQKNVEKLCDLLIQAGTPITWCCFARCDCVSEGLLKKMKQAGCHQILYGIESADADILTNVGKHINAAKNNMAVTMTKAAGITTRCAFMLGNPGETEASIERTIRYSIDLDPDIALYNITTPYPGTKMFAWAKEKGFLLSENWDDYDLSKPVMRLPSLTADALQRGYKKSYRAFYFRPRYILKCLRRGVSPAGLRMLAQGFRKMLVLSR